MTEPKRPHVADPALPLPGLDTPSGRGVPELEIAVRRTLVELHRQGHVHEVDAGKAQLALEMAQAIATKRATGRMSTLGNDARVLMEILDAFTADTETDVDADLAQAMAEWSEVAHGAHGPAEVRDPS